MLAKLLCHTNRESLDRVLHEVAHDIATATADQEVSLGHLDDETAPLLDHERRRIFGGDQVRHHGLAKSVGGVLQVCLPK
jgi:hypothetical protein